MQIGKSNQPVLIKQYPDWPFYRPDFSGYLTSGHLMAMARADEGFVIIDAKTREDVTVTFAPIKVEQ